MSAFELLRIANSSLGMHQTWLDALAHNISNANTMRRTDETAFQAQLVNARSRADGGVEVGSIELGSAEGRMTYQPDHPLADENGYVRAPDIDMGSQMSQLIMAQRGFQAQSSVLRNAQDVYSSALSIGKQS